MADAAMETLTTHGLVIASTAITAALILVQGCAIIVGLVKMHRDFMATIGKLHESMERMETYRLVERK